MGVGMRSQIGAAMRVPPSGVPAARWGRRSRPASASGPGREGAWEPGRCDPRSAPAKPGMSVPEGAPRVNGSRGAWARIGILAVLSGVATARAALATSAADLCDSSSDPCIVAGTWIVDDRSVIDVGARELRIMGRLDVGSGTMTLRARRLAVSGSLAARGSANRAGGTIVALADTVLLDGTIDATGARGGSIDLTANGELAVRATVAADASNSLGEGGSVTLGGAAVTVNAAVTARGGADEAGGSITIRASGEAVVAGQLNASGGEGGSIEIEAGSAVSGDLTVAVGARLLADALCKGCDGGAITLMAGGPGNPGSAAAVDGQLHATGLDGNRDEVGGTGGTISVSASGEVRIGAFAVLRARGGAPDGFGGDVVLASGRATRIAGEIDVGANGRDSLGGAVRAEAGGEVEVAGAIRTRAFIGGDVAIIAGGSSLTLASGAEIDTRASTSAAGGNVTMASSGDLRVNGAVRSDGGSGPQGAGGRNEASGCLIEVGPTGILRSRGSGGANVLTGRSAIIIAGTLLADPDAGRNEIRYPSREQLPVYIDGAAVDPRAEEVVDGSLRPCRPTRPPTPTASLTPPPSPTPTRTPGGCPGDCNGNGLVTVDEVVLGTNIGLDLLPLASCAAMDTNRDGLVMVSELIAAVLAGLGGCES